jgi:MFS family permease
MEPARTEPLSPSEVERGLALVIRDGVCTQIMITLIGGVFLTDFALGLGAGGLAIGLIVAIPALGNLIQVPTVALVEAVRRRRAIVVAGAGLSRLVLLALALLPFLPAAERTAGAGVVLLLAGLALAFALASVSHCAWNSWMRDLVPTPRLGNFFGRRMMIMAALSAGLTPLAGLYVEWFRAGWPALGSYTYVPVFALGALAGLIGVWVLAITPEPPMARADERIGFFRRALGPFRDSGYRRVLLFLFVWNATANLAAPFFAVYLLRRIGLEVGPVTVLYATFQIANLIAFGAWGRIADRHANRAVLAVTVPGFMAMIPGFLLAAAVPNPALAFALLLALHVVLGLAHAGVQLACGTVALKLAPPGEATAYLAVVSLAVNLGAAGAPVVGGWLVDRLGDLALPLALPGLDVPFLLGGWDILFLLAFVGGLGATAAARAIREDSAIGARRALLEFAREFAADLARGPAGLIGRRRQG